MKTAFALALLALGACAQEGNLIVQKTIDSEYPAVYSKGKNFTVVFNIFNIGDGSAFNIKIQDQWPETTSSGTTAFELSEGSFEAEFAEIPAGGNETFSFNVVPQFEGHFDGSRAGGTYQATADGSPKTVYSTVTRPMDILSADSYAKYFAHHYQEWTIFYVCALGTVVVPLFVWGYIQVSYTGGIPNAPVKKD